MAGRRRKWLIAAALLALVAALAWALLGRGGRMEVQLVFIGYTNYPATFTNPPPGTAVFTGTAFRAIVLATNSGDMTVELYESYRYLNTSLLVTATQWRGGVAVPIDMNSPTILKPGETVLVGVVPQNPGPWSTELRVERRGLGDRLYVKGHTKGNATVQRMTEMCLSPPPESWATLGPITNALPQEWAQVLAALGRSTNPPPDMESVLDGKKSERQRRPVPSLLDGGTYR